MKIIGLTALATVAYAQVSSSPHGYPGKPTGGFSTEWQSYFQVTQSLPNVSFPLGRNWAGNLPVQREGHPNNTLFFWAFEKTNGSFTDENNQEPWAIWLNGGPGSSSMTGLFFENGPIQIRGDYSIAPHDLSWDKFADYIWIDQPVGVGFATADAAGYVASEDQMGQDFIGFLENLVKVFPSLATRPLYFTGESYAGTYIPYILKALFSIPKPPVKVGKIAIGDGSIGSQQEFEFLPVVNVIQTYPQIIGYDTEVFQYFKEQQHLCGYDLNLTYPQNGHFPSLALVLPENPALLGFKLASRNRKFTTFKSFTRDVSARYRATSGRLRRRDRERDLKQWKRDLSGRANGTIDTWYGCDLYDELYDYAINFTYPWSLSQSSGGVFDVYDVPDGLNLEVPMDASVFLNDPQTRSALHAPIKTWIDSFAYPFAAPGSIDPSVEPMAFLTDLSTNMTAHDVSVVLFSGNDDSLIPHTGTQVIIQNTTFGRIQGFSRKPSTPWYDDAGEFAGIVHQERNWTYVLVKGAGHLVGYNNPSSAFVFAREFLFGNNQTGLVVNAVDGNTYVVGGENATLAQDVLPGQAGIYYGSAATQSTYFFPTATIAAWQSFIQTATATPSST